MTTDGQAAVPRPRLSAIAWRYTKMAWGRVDVDLDDVPPDHRDQEEWLSGHRITAYLIALVVVSPLYAMMIGVGVMLYLWD